MPFDYVNKVERPLDEGRVELWDNFVKSKERKIEVYKLKIDCKICFRVWQASVMKDLTDTLECPDCGEITKIPWEE